MGSLLGEIRREYVSRYGLAQWDSHLNSIGEIWDGIHRMILDLDLPYANVRLYQDGLPQCDKEAEIVQDVAARGSKNHQLLSADILVRHLMPSTGDAVAARDR